MTNKTKAAVWTSIILIALSFLSVYITYYPKIALYILAIGAIGIAISIIYYAILAILGDE